MTTMQGLKSSFDALKALMTKGMSETALNKSDFKVYIDNFAAAAKSV